MSDNCDRTDLGRQLDALIDRATELEHRYAGDLQRVHPKLRDSAINLVHYMALRQIDIRGLQRELASLGLSSLGRAERDVMGSLRAVRAALRSMTVCEPCDLNEQVIDLDNSDARLERHVNDLLGVRTDGRDVRIMVTLPTEAATDYALVRNMLAAGMDIARINCSHDSEPVWLRMVEHIHRARHELDRTCQIVMDLAGLKIRTGQLRPGPGVVRIHPKRDSLGRPKTPGRVRFVPDGAPLSDKKGAVVPVPRKCIEKADVGDTFTFRDTRNKKRILRVTGKDQDGLILECYKNAYVATGTKLKLDHPDGLWKYRCRVGHLPPTQEPLILKPGDTLVLHRDTTLGENASVVGDVTMSAHVSLQPADVLKFVSAGDRVSLNDGKIEGVVTSASPEQLSVLIDFAKARGSKLRAGKGINFPDSDITLRGLTEVDRHALDFVVRHADVVGQSFVRTPEDVEALKEELDSHPSRQLGTILKIETVKAFNSLPDVLLTAMRHYPVGVMIARGDLAVECGWVRLAEIQEEILWLCEAARLPVIWATQVLERETKKGQPSRAEITDAAMSQRADCVMLNKGPYILSAIRMLDDILRRMQSHQHKKTPTLRKLGVATEGEGRR